MSRTSCLRYVLIVAFVLYWSTLVAGAVFLMYAAHVPSLPSLSSSPTPYSLLLLLLCRPTLYSESVFPTLYYSLPTPTPTDLFSFPTPYCILPTPTPYSQLTTPYCVLPTPTPTAYSLPLLLLPTPYSYSESYSYS